MKSAGIDIGSRTIKLVIVENGKVTLTRKKENSFEPLKICSDLLKGLNYDKITATGYGRNLFRKNFDCEVISEIKACSVGTKAIFPLCQTILDIGGQDTKAISLDENGKILKFEMNDRCAAGTGRFLEIMAMALGCSVPDFGTEALSAKKAEKINSMCTVFAESEVISTLSKGASRNEIALGIHQSIVKRSIVQLKKVGIKNNITFVGGVALNPCIQKLLECYTGKNVIIPPDPQIVTAFGCALYGYAKLQGNT